MKLVRGDSQFELVKFEAVNDKINKYVGLLDEKTKRGYTVSDSEESLLNELSAIDLDLIGYTLQTQD